MVSHDGPAVGPPTFGGDAQEGDFLRLAEGLLRLQIEARIIRSQADDGLDPEVVDSLLEALQRQLAAAIEDVVFNDFQIAKVVLADIGITDGRADDEQREEQAEGKV